MAIVLYTSVDDVGRPINPLIVEGQTYGGIVQGLGQVICENAAWDPASGQVLTGSFMDYALPRADEGGTVPGLAAATNALMHALAEDGGGRNRHAGQRRAHLGRAAGGTAPRRTFA